MLLYTLPFAAGIVAVSMSHLSWRKSALARVISSLLLFPLTWVMVYSFGNHLCDQGGAPAYISVTVAAFVTATPWLPSLSFWFQRLAAGTLILLGMFTTSMLASSYHGDDVTANPAYSDGHFWHTSISGQYPRSIPIGGLQALEQQRLNELLERLEKANQNDTEQCMGLDAE
jgi:hypothetical protein